MDLLTNTYRCQKKIEITNGNLLEFGCIFGFHQMMPRFFDVARAVRYVNARWMVQFAHRIAWVVCISTGLIDAIDVVLGGCQFYIDKCIDVCQLPPILTHWNVAASRSVQIASRWQISGKMLDGKLENMRQ